MKDVEPVDVAAECLIPLHRIGKDYFRYWFLNLVLKQVLKLLHLPQIDSRTWDDVGNGLSCSICDFSCQGGNREEEK